MTLIPARAFIRSFVMHALTFSSSIARARPTASRPCAARCVRAMRGGDDDAIVVDSSRSLEG